MKFFVRIHEARVYQQTVEARSLDEAKRIIEGLHAAGELPADIMDLETIAVEHPCERAA